MACKCSERFACASVCMRTYVRACVRSCLRLCQCVRFLHACVRACSRVCDGRRRARTARGVLVSRGRDAPAAANSAAARCGPPPARLGKAAAARGRHAACASRPCLGSSAVRCFLSCYEGQTVYLSKRSFKSLASPEAGRPLQQFLDLIQQRRYALNNAVVVSDGPRDEPSSPKERRSRRMRKGSSSYRTSGLVSTVNP
jgi:hypothetical protein